MSNPPAVTMVLSDAGIQSADVSLAIVDDATMRQLNRRHLEHDFATDVLSFLLEHNGVWLEGEIIVSADTAAGSAGRFGWNTADELLLYVIHGALHLIGHDDQEPAALAVMRSRERHYLSQFGLSPQYIEDGER